MTPDNARRAAVLGAVLAGGITAADRMADGELPKARIFAGTAVAAVALAVAAEWQPKLATGFAALAVLGAAATAPNLQRRAADYFGG